MNEDWKVKAWTYLWLTVVGLCASTVRWNELVYDKQGNFRWGLVIVQVMTAFSIGVIAHAAVPMVLHFLPYAGSLVAEGLTGVLAFAGPLVITRAVDAFLSRFGGKT